MFKASHKVGVGSAHSKLILIGEHAVVYDQPAIAIPFPKVNVSCEVTQKQGAVSFISDFYTGEMASIPEKMKGFAECVKEVCRHVKQPLENLQIQLSSSIPIGRGLGSSAAIAVALVRGLFDFFDLKLSRFELRRFVDLAERYAHGTPSGIDMEATSHNEPIWFEKNKVVEALTIEHPFYFVVADTGRIGDTHAAVASIKKKHKNDYYSTKAKVERIGLLTSQAQIALKTGDSELLGDALNQAHHNLAQLGVSDPGLDYYVEMSQKAGALGAKLTGGGRGGCMIALAPSLTVAAEIEQALLQVGATQTWQHTIGMR